MRSQGDNDDIKLYAFELYYRIVFLIWKVIKWAAPATLG